MNRIPQRLLAGAVLAAIPLASGCVVRTEPPHAYVEVEPGPVVYDDYYYRGYYDGPVYYWHDRDGRLRHEERAMHERREYSEHRAHAEEHRGGEHHEGEHREGEHEHH